MIMLDLDYTKIKLKTNLRIDLVKKFYNQLSI